MMFPPVGSYRFNSTFKLKLSTLSKSQYQRLPFGGVNCEQIASF